MSGVLKPSDPRNCSACGREFMQTPEQVRKCRARTTCSDECWVKARSRALFKHDYPVTKSCDFCGAGFLCHDSTQVLKNQFCAAHHYNSSRMHNGVLGPYNCVDCAAGDCWQKSYDRGRPPRCEQCAKRHAKERERQSRSDSPRAELPPVTRVRTVRQQKPSRLIGRECVVCNGLVRRYASYYARIKTVTCSKKMQERGCATRAS